MLQLLKLELKKWKLSSFLLSAGITDLILLSFLLPVFFAKNSGFPKTSNDILMLIDTLSRFTYIIFGGVLTARIVIDEYQDRTIQLLFTYPISRKKLVSAKLIFTVFVTFFTLVFSRILLFGAANLLDSISTGSSYFLFDSLPQDYILLSLLNDFAYSGLCLIAFAFGMIKKSSKHAIIASVVLSLIISGNIGNVDLGSSILTPLIITAIGLIVALVSLQKIETADFV